MSRPSNTTERQLQISRGLRRVMARRGYEAASIAEVARAARLTPGLVHYHFENKRAILLFMLEELADLHERRLEAAVAAAGDDPRARLLRFVDAHLAVGPDADPEALACWIALGGEALRDREVRERYQRVLHGLIDRAELLLAAAAPGGTPAPARREAACALVAALQGYLVLAGTARALIPPGSAAPQVRRMALALAAEESP